MLKDSPPARQRSRDHAGLGYLNEPSASVMKIGAFWLSGNYFANLSFPALLALRVIYCILSLTTHRDHSDAHAKLDRPVLA